MKKLGDVIEFGVPNGTPIKWYEYRIVVTTGGKTRSLGIEIKTRLFRVTIGLNWTYSFELGYERLKPLTWLRFGVLFTLPFELFGCQFFIPLWPIKQDTRSRAEMAQNKDNA